MIHKWSPGLGILCVWPKVWPCGFYKTSFRWVNVTCKKCLKIKAQKRERREP
jgi:hypothetical protein